MMRDLSSFLAGFAILVAIFPLKIREEITDQNQLIFLWILFALCAIILVLFSILCMLWHIARKMDGSNKQTLNQGEQHDTTT